MESAVACQKFWELNILSEASILRLTGSQQLALKEAECTTWERKKLPQDG